MLDYWSFTEEYANNELEEFISDKVQDYPRDRDRPDRNGTSNLSPYFHFGIISPHQAYHYANSHKNQHNSNGIEKYISELYWREFSYNLIYNFPELSERNFRPEFDNFPWADNEELIARWRRGKTGYPIVDAGMRELWETGWMHNRVRMIVGSFLTKHLLTHWKHGEEWFWDTLVDASPANNTASWQWVAGCGADAAPYFRIFNPITQGEKFDPNGDYVRKWVPEVSDLPNNLIHKPWEANQDILEAANLELGTDYPKPAVNHFEARNSALKAYEKIKRIKPN
jgi:deoxyribodipyrimidine photo-lyase